MNWYYENNGKPIGPITDTVMREWVKQKSLAPAQLVRKEGESEWQILAQTDLCITQENEAGFRLSAAPKHQTESTNMNLTEELSKLADLRSSGALSEAEFIQAKAKLLAPVSEPLEGTIHERRSPLPRALDDGEKNTNSLGEAANRYVTFQIVMTCIGILIFLFVAAPIMCSGPSSGPRISGPSIQFTPH